MFGAGHHSLVRSVFVVLFVLGMTAPAVAITFGEPDGGSHPYVGVFTWKDESDVTFDLINEAPYCSGTLLSETVMLTSAHCVYNYYGDIYLRFNENATEGIESEDFATDEEFLEENWIKATNVDFHPDYVDDDFPFTYDVAIITIKKKDKVVLDVYGELPDVGLLDDVLDGPNDMNLWTNVGYGIFEPESDPFFEGDQFLRYKSTTVLKELVSAQSGGLTAKFSNNPGGGTGGTCFGDSGGPVFHMDTNVIGAITSSGIGCQGVDYPFRVDHQEVKEFVELYL